ncbi:CHAT domain-containing tetratricopeptide repeat protein [Aquimarina sp. 2201CG5-10]|uniref:CHAT domain-containing tetratricopeptide repeat protein n=1 Tax=Aquimarina callyspongiae TaxID=3098150 RepID=UPI002AB517DB|nr:CHAT domain-containing tetratricopeptide repeat protein [Aquimarina sp. 2201CG5-10]MDY8138620.1 CHAT domain-containing tetratricopeptide repeat protein [Aquimarina sp. 2201CG5-10]
MIEHKITFSVFFFILFLSLIPLKTTAQDFREIINSELSLEEKDKSIKVLLDNYLKDNDSLNYSLTSGRYAAWLSKIENTDQAIHYYKISVSHSPNPDKDLTSKKIYLNGLLNLGWIYKKTYDYILAIKAFQDIILFESSIDVISYTPHIYLELAETNKIIGDHHKAIDYFEKALAIFKSQKKYKNQLNTLIRLSQTYQEIYNEESFEKGLQNLQQVDSLKKHIAIDLNNEYLINESKGNLYNSSKKYDPYECLKYYKKALQIALEQDNGYRISASYKNIGNIYHGKNPDTSLYYFHKALEYPQYNSISKARTFFNIGISYLYKKQYSKAINSLETALDTLGIHKKNTGDSFSESISNIKDKDLVLQVLKRAGVIWLEQYHTDTKKDTLYLKESLSYFKQADKLIDLIKLESSGDQSKLYWREQASGLYIHIVDICHLLGESELAYHYMEKNKALLLLEDATQDQIKRITNIPSFIEKKETLFKRNIAKTKNLISDTKNKALKDSLKIKLFDQKEKYEHFVDSLKVDYPQYYYSKKGVTILQLEEVKKYTQKQNTSFLQYILNDTEGFGLMISDHNTILFELKNISSLLKDIEQFTTLISQPFSTKRDKSLYEETAKTLYNSLFPEQVRPHLKQKISVIPDYTLNNIPFEALITNTNRYMIEDFEISYAYSISFLNQNKKLKRTSKKEFLGFAPVNYSNSLSTLPNSKKEIEEVSIHFKSDNLLLKNASKQSLIDLITDYKVIHLSTHANANDSITPWIASTNDKITLNDIYTTKNNAELVVLSACNTSVGKIEKGEGVMSLARGFFNTGANSVVSTLWKADDSSTLELSIDFYAYLKEGKSKSEALRLAKLNYLQNHSLSQASPYYWSSLILIGDPDPIYTSSKILFLVIGFILSIGLIFFIYKKKSKK